MINLIGIGSKKGVGKDLTAEIIQYLTDKTQLSFLQWKDVRDKCLKGYGGSWYTSSLWENKKFAFKLKQVCFLLTGIPVEDFEKQEVKSEYLNEEWDYYPVIGYDRGNDPIYSQEKCRMQVRRLLQLVGTEGMRNGVHSDVWINALFAKWRNSNKSSVHSPSYWIISDMRFPNEMEAIKSRGGITICVNRTTGQMDHHPSETALDECPFHYIIDNNGSVEELIGKVREILIKEQIIKK